MTETAAATLQSLDWRVKRLEHYLSTASTRTGSDLEDVENDEPQLETVHARLSSLERRFADVIQGNYSADTLLRLQNEHPELANHRDKDDTSGDESAAKLSIVLSSAQAYADTVSRLTTLQQYPMPDTKELVTLLSQRSRLEKFEAMQSNQLAEIQDLQQRSIALVAEWYQHHVLQSSEQWSAWEERMLQAEQIVRRREAAKARNADEY